jgi:RNA recognition motif-containing protein
MFIQVSNLTYNITEESLSATFAAYGSVNSTLLLKELADEQPVYIALIEMPDATEAMQAVAKLDQAILDGRFISVKLLPAADKKSTPKLVY